MTIAADCVGRCNRAVQQEVAERLAATFKVLSDPTRVRMISALAEGPLCVHELAEAVSLSQSATSHQLALMRDMRLVVGTKQGRHVVYRLDDDHIEGLYRQGLAHVAHA